MKTVGNIDFGLERPWEIQVPDDAFVFDGVPEHRIDPPLSPEEQEKQLLAAIRKPIGAKPLADLVDEQSKITIAINDWIGVGATAVPVVLKELLRAGVDERNIQFMVAGGTHPKVTRNALYLGEIGRTINPPYPSVFHPLPPEVVDKFWPTSYETSRIRIHDASDKKHLVNLGTTEYGNLVEMNDCVVNSDLVIYIGGWTAMPSTWGLGGAQGVAVGLGSAESILSHHHVRVHEHPDSATSDPRHQLFMKHKEAVADFVDDAIGGKMFYIEATCNTRWQVSSVWAGKGKALRDAMYDWVFERGEKVVEVPQQFDVFVTGGAYWGMFYDTVNNPLLAMGQICRKVREFVPPNPVLRKGGIAIMCAPTDGNINTKWRPHDREMLELFNRLGHDARKLEDYYDEYLHREDLLYKYRYANACHPLHPFWLLSQNDFILRHAGAVIIAGARDPDGVALAGGIAVDTFEDAWRLATHLLNDKNPSTIVTTDTASRAPVYWKVKG